MEVSLNYCSQNGGNLYRAPYYNGNLNIGPHIVGNLDQSPYVELSSGSVALFSRNPACSPLSVTRRDLPSLSQQAVSTLPRPPSMRKDFRGAGRHVNKKHAKLKHNYSQPESVNTKPKALNIIRYI